MGKCLQKFIVVGMDEIKNVSPSDGWKIKDFKISHCNADHTLNKVVILLEKEE